LDSHLNSLLPDRFTPNRAANVLTDSSIKYSSWPLEPSVATRFPADFLQLD
jgi:hypothetical protein